MSQQQELARQLLEYMTPLIVGGALARAGEQSPNPTTALAVRTWDTLQRLFRDNESASEELEHYQRRPEAKNRAQTVEGEIVTVLAQQPQAATDVRALIDEARKLGLLAPAVNNSRSQQISGNAQVGMAINGDVNGSVTFNQPKGDVVYGDKFGGDKVAGDKIVHYGAPRPADTSPEHVQRLIDINTRRLRVLEEQKTRFGYNVPPHVSMEIEDLRAEIARLEGLKG